MPDLRKVDEGLEIEMAEGTSKLELKAEKSIKTKADQRKLIDQKGSSWRRFARRKAGPTKPVGKPNPELEDWKPRNNKLKEKKLGEESRKRISR